MIYVDRIENGIAVLELDDDRYINIPAERLPAGTHEGSALEYVDGEYILNDDAEQKRRDRLYALQQRLFGGK